jgi:hypothetical protein
VILHEDIPGWSLPGEFEALAAYAAKCPGPWVEIGSYCGRSTLALAEVADGRTLFAVDPHRGNPEMAPGRDCHHPEVWARENGSLSVLLDTIADYDNVIPVVGPGHRFAETGVRPGFVFIDGDHSYRGCKADVTVWGELLAPNGLLAMHDATTGPPLQVREELEADGWELVDLVGCLAVLARG